MSPPIKPKLLVEAGTAAGIPAALAPAPTLVLELAGNVPPGITDPGAAEELPSGVVTHHGAWELLSIVLVASCSVSEAWPITVFMLASPRVAVVIILLSWGVAGASWAVGKGDSNWGDLKTD